MSASVQRPTISALRRGEATTPFTDCRVGDFSGQKPGRRRGRHVRAGRGRWRQRLRRIHPDVQDDIRVPVTPDGGNGGSRPGDSNPPSAGTAGKPSGGGGGAGTASTGGDGGGGYNGAVVAAEVAAIPFVRRDQLRRVHRRAGAERDHHLSGEPHAVRPGHHDAVGWRRGCPGCWRVDRSLRHRHLPRRSGGRRQAARIGRLLAPPARVAPTKILVSPPVRWA